MQPIPHYQQVNDYYCGPAILQMVFGYFGISITQDEAAARLRTTEAHGTTPEALKMQFEAAGLTVTGGNNQTLADLQKALDEQKIIIVCYTELHLQWDHYAIVQAFDTNEISLVDPAEDKAPFVLPIGEFEKRWVGPLFTHTDHWAIYVNR